MQEPSSVTNWLPRWFLGRDLKKTQKEGLLHLRRQMKVRNLVSCLNCVCICCNKPANKDSIQCEYCHELEHYQRAGISYKMLGNSCPNVMFFCTICQPKLTLTLKFVNDIEDRFLARFICNDYSRSSSVTEMLQSLSLQTLSQRQDTAKLVFMHKVLYQVVDVSVPDWTLVVTNQGSCNYRLMLTPKNTPFINQRYDSGIPSLIITWLKLTQ